MRSVLRAPALLLALSISIATVAGCVAAENDAPVPESPSSAVSQSQYAGNNPVGTWSLRGIAGKCFDVGGYPRGNNALVYIYTCNGTAAQRITVAPSNAARTEHEIRAHGRCLTVNGPIAAGSYLVLSRCDGGRAQQFVTDGAIRLRPADATNVYVTVTNATGNDRTLMNLQTYRNSDTQKWDFEQIDTTPYSSTTLVPERGTVAFVGLGNKCLDIGGPPHPTRAPAILYGCNGTLAQRFNITPVAGTRGQVELRAAGRCLEVSPNQPQVVRPILVASAAPAPASAAAPVTAATLDLAATSTSRTVSGRGLSGIDLGGLFPTTPYFAGAEVMLTECAGRETQRFGIEVFDGGYVFPATHPELALGVRGASTANRTQIELQSRAAAASHQWRVVGVEGAGYTPLLPSVYFGRANVTDHTTGGDGQQRTVPALFLQDLSGTESSLTFLYRRLGTDAYTERLVSGSLSGTGQRRFFTPPFVKDEAYEVKVRAQGPSGFAESVPFTVDSRTPNHVKNLSYSELESDEVKLSWQGPGSPRVDSYRIEYWSENSVKVTAGDTQGDYSYTKRITDLHSNRDYTFRVIAHNDLWGDSSPSASISVKTPSSGGGGGGGGGGSFPIYVCGTSGLGCPAGYHPAEYLHGSSCSSSGVEKNQTRCDANGSVFNACGTQSCPAGWHATGFDFRTACDLQVSTGSIDPNSTNCSQNTNDFWTCGGCPTGYSVTGEDTASSCDGYPHRHCSRP